LGSARTRLRQSREVELRLLTMPEVRDLLSESGISLISYRELNDPEARPNTSWTGKPFDASRLYKLPS